MRLLFWALLPVSIWACSVKMINHVYGLNSTPGTWAAYTGFPGLMVGSLIVALRGSETAFYIAIFLGNWLFYFFIMKAALALRNILAKLPN
jgi:hypothetical protein